VPYYLGIDGGGSKTTCAIGDETSTLATVIAGPSNITRVGEARARESLHQTIRDACAAAKTAPAQIQRSCIGAAGAGREEVANVIRKIAAEVIPGKIEVVGDMPIALEAAFGAGPGVIVIAGTGSIAYGRDQHSNTARAGGWGFAISDEGSAHWIGRTAISQVLRAMDELTLQDNSKPVTDPEDAPFLLERLMRVRGERSFDEFLRSANSDLDFAVFFPAVVSAAEAGDSIALDTLTRAAKELAGLCSIVLRKLFAKEISSPVPLAIAGGVFRHARFSREVFYNEVRSLPHPVDVRTEIVEPVNGALQMARRGSNAA
jgi:glucosamine kinase